MSQPRIPLFRQALFNIGTEFTDLDIKERCASYLNDLKALFPAIQKLKGAYLDRRYQFVDSQMILIIDLVLTPQGRFDWPSADGLQISDSRLLECMRRQLYASGTSTQARIYRESCEANFGDPDNTPDQRAREDVHLLGRMRKLKGDILNLDTAEGQIRFDFPDVPDYQVAESSGLISGFVESVSPARIKLQAVRPEGDRSYWDRYRLSRKGVWVHLPFGDDNFPREVEALRSAHTRSRVAMMVRPASCPLTRRIHHLILDSSAQEVRPAAPTPAAHAALGTYDYCTPQVLAD